MERETLSLSLSPEGRGDVSRAEGEERETLSLSLSLSLSLCLSLGLSSFLLVLNRFAKHLLTSVMENLKSPPFWSERAAYVSVTVWTRGASAC